MARYDHLPIFKSAYILCLNVYKITRNFNREYKYTLGEKMKETSHRIVSLIIDTNSMENNVKTAGIAKILLETERLRIYSRIACDLKIFPIKHLGTITENLENLEKQSGGWIKWLKSNNDSCYTHSC